MIEVPKKTLGKHLPAMGNTFSEVCCLHVSNQSIRLAKTFLTFHFHEKVKFPMMLMKTQKVMSHTLARHACSSSIWLTFWPSGLPQVRAKMVSKLKRNAYGARVWETFKNKTYQQLTATHEVCYLAITVSPYLTY